MKKRYVQFVSILPVNRVPHKVLLEVLEEELQQGYQQKFGSDFVVYASDTIRVNGKAVRLRVIEK